MHSKRVTHQSSETEKPEEIQFFFQKLLDMLPDLVSYIDKDLRFRFANNAYQQFFNIDAALMAGLHPWDVLGRKAYQKVAAKQRAALAGNEQHYESHIQLDSGKRLYFKAHYLPHYDQGEVVGFLAIVRDISARKRTERIIKKREKELEQKTKELKSINTALEVLLKHRDKQIHSIKEKVCRDFNKLILPELLNLRDRATSNASATAINLVIDGMKTLTSPESSRLTSELIGLTKTELRIANAVKNGMTSREICDYFSVSPNTVSYHRRNIRKKLGIDHASISLSTYLATLG